MEIALITVRALQFAAQISLAGSFGFVALVAAPVYARAGSAISFTLRRRLAIIAGSSLVIALLSGVPWLFLVGQSMSARALPDTLTQGVITTVMTETRFGHAFLLRMGLLVLLIPLAVTIGKRRGSDVFATLVAMLLLSATAWEGHAGAEGGLDGVIHLGADAFHFVAAGLWVGALVPLALLLAETRREGSRRDAMLARAATRAFSSVGLLCVTTLLITGTVNAWFLVGMPAALIGTFYGQILFLKLTLFAAMLVLAAANRFYLLPRLATSDHGRKAVESRKAIALIARHALIEAGLGLGIIAIVGMLGTQVPAAHELVRWPFSYRLGLDAITADPDLRNDAIGTAIIAGLGLALLGFGWRRRHTLSIATGLVLFLGLGWRPVQLLILDATPTSYYISLEPFAVSSINVGRLLYVQNCVACHGEGGQGNGPAAASLAVAPADLTTHLFVHTEGDLFWFISNGMDDGAMPSFANSLDETQIWALINFLKARASGIEAGTIGATVTGDPAPLAPDFEFVEADGTVTTLKSLLTREAALLVLDETPQSQRRTQLENWRNVLAESGIALIIISKDSDLRSAYALFDRRDKADSPSIEFLIDRGGNIRALWHQDDTPDWRDLAVLTRQIDMMARLMLAPRRQATHRHPLN